MGGKSQGDVASQEVVADLEAWFYHEDIGILNEITTVSAILDKRVKEYFKVLENNLSPSFRMQSSLFLKTPAPDECI